MRQHLSFIFHTFQDTQQIYPRETLTVKCPIFNDKDYKFKSFFNQKAYLKKESSRGEPAPLSSCSIRANYNYTPV